MTTVSIKEAKNRLAALARKVEKGETVVVTRNGKPVLDLVPHGSKRGLDFEAGKAYLRRRGIKQKRPYIAEDFDAPLAEDFLKDDRFEYRLENDKRSLRRIKGARKSIHAGRGSRLEDVKF